MSKNKKQVNKWELYEAEKKKLQGLTLTPAQYDAKIAEIVRRLKI